MVKNDLRLYFLNDQYDDLVVSQFLTKLNHKLYSTSLRQGSLMQNITSYTGYMSDFTVNEDYNKKFGLPPKSYVAKINAEIFPVYDEKRFIRIYGYGSEIPLLTIMKDHSVFARSPIVYIDKYALFKVSFIVFPNQTHVIIKPTPSEGLSINTMNEFISNNAPWSIILNQKSDYYYTYKERTVLFSGTSIDSNLFTEKILYDKKDKTDHWDIYMSISQTEPNLLVQSIATSTEINGRMYFNVSQKFKNYVYSSVSAIKVHLLNSYRKNGHGKFIYDGTNIPIVQIPFDKNPVPIDSIIVWKYDKEDDIKVNLIENNIIHYYPNIYDLRNMWDGTSDLLIEWFENNPPDVDFDNNFKEYMDCYGEDFVTMIINKTAPNPIMEYSPLPEFIFDYDDYKASEFFGDVRAYKLSKLITLLRDNPMRYDLFMNQIYSKIQKKSTMVCTKSTHSYIFNTSKMDNYNECGENTSLRKTFSEPMTYIRFYNRDARSKSVYIFVDGKRIPIEHMMNVGYYGYVYFAKRYVNDNSKIVVDVSNISDMDPVVGDIYFNTMNNFVVFPNPENFRFVSGKDLQYIKSYNNEYINQDLLSYQISLDTYYIIHESFRENYLSMMYYLVTSENEIFSPINADLFVLRSDQTIVPINDKNFYKRIDSHRLSIACVDRSLLNFVIKVTRTDIYQSKYIKNGAVVIMFDRFKGKPDASRFRVFVGGILLSPSQQYVIKLPSKYDGTAEIIITDCPSTGDRNDVLVEYIPFDEEILYNDIPSEQIYRNGLFYFDEISNKPINLRLCRIYIDGLRVSNDDIIYTGINDIYKIKNYSGGRLTIYQQKTDPDPYEYISSKNDMPINMVMKSDSVFENYISNK